MTPRTLMLPFLVWVLLSSTAWAWEWATLLPHNNYIYDVWGANETFVFAVGYGGEVSQFNGTDWRSRHFNTYDSWLGVGGKEGNVYLVGQDGIISHRAANQTHFWGERSRTNIDLRDVFVVDDDDVHAVGGNGSEAVVTHYDGSSWKSTYFNYINYLFSVHGFSRNDVYAAGGNSSGTAILHFDGRAWSPMDPDLYTGWCYGVWGSGPDDIHFACAIGMFHYDGRNWTRTTNGYDHPCMYGVYGRDGDDVYAVGEAYPDYLPMVLRYDGSAWTRVHNDTDKSHYLRAVWTAPDARVHAVGGRGVLTSSGPPPSSATGCVLNPAAQARPEAWLVLVPALSLLGARLRMKTG